jgi:hypothetical protein
MDQNERLGLLLVIAIALLSLVVFMAIVLI